MSQFMIAVFMRFKTGILSSQSKETLRYTGCWDDVTNEGGGE